ALLRLGAPGRASCSEVKVIATHHLEDIRAKLSDLKKLERLLAKTVARCSGKKHQIAPFWIFSIFDGRPNVLTGSSTTRAPQPQRMSALPPKADIATWLPCRLRAQKRTCAPQQKAPLFDHLVGAGEQCGSSKFRVRRLLGPRLGLKSVISCPSDLTLFDPCRSAARS